MGGSRRLQKPRPARALPSHFNYNCSINRDTKSICFSRSPVLIAACALALLALAVAGCGGGGGDESRPLLVTKAVFLEKGNEACDGAYNRKKRRFHAFTKGKDKPFSTEAEEREFLETVVVPNRKRLVEEMKAIGVPVDDEDRAEAILAAFEDGIREAEDDPVGAMSSYVGPFGEAAELTQEYGLKNCR